MILYKNFSWQQPEHIIQGLPEPRKCPHCGGSALLDANGNIECQLDWHKKSEKCGYNHYETMSVKRSIELWNKYDCYSQVKFEELSDVHYFLIHRCYPD
jgi:hypothetical protein